ncbi:hypothetical protein [Candidatus Blastococcus massiliensis]|nr:hypothetical protein [Candidatus Blastococcus massiliensis]
MDHAQHHGEGVRRYFRVGFWLVAAGAAVALGLDLDGDVLV